MQPFSLQLQPWRIVLAWLDGAGDLHHGQTLECPIVHEEGAFDGFHEPV